MPGRVMTAQQAKKEYGFKSMKASGNKITLKNSQGKKITVGKNDRVYHRGHGNFAPYSESRDANRDSRHDRRSRDRVGKGSYRHTKD